MINRNKPKDAGADKAADEARVLLAAVSLLGASLGVTPSTPAGAETPKGHMAAGTQDSMKRVLFGAAGVSGKKSQPPPPSKATSGPSRAPHTK